MKNAKEAVHTNKTSKLAKPVTSMLLPKSDGGNLVSPSSYAVAGGALHMIGGK